MRGPAWIRRRPKLAAVSALLVAGLTAVALWIRCGPIPADLLDRSRTRSTTVVDRHGVVLYESRSEAGTRTDWLAAADLPPALVNATIAVEDHRFRSHPGVDVLAIARALRRNLAAGRTVEGGSTITQQVAKLLIDRRAARAQRGLAEKIDEAMLALRLEHRFDKDEILAMYLNLAAYGNQTAGAARASRAYFGKPASMLTIAEAAFLAGLPQRPSGFNPYRHGAAAARRQQFVLHRMRATGAMTPSQLDEALAETLTLVRAPAPFRAPHFVSMVLGPGGDERARPVRIETTLDAALQDDVTGIIRTHRPALDRHGASNVAVVVLDNRTGEWLAWEGSGDYGAADDGGTINGPLVPRQPGSALKPFTYALAFETGFTPASVLPDVPAQFPTAEPGIVYAPRNYDDRFRGPMLARRALAGSENVPAVALAAELGVPHLVRFLARAGLSSFDRTPSYYGLGVTLGNAEVRLADLTAAYAAFARGGEWLEPTWRHGEAAAARQQAHRRLVSPRAAFWVGDILSDADARAFIFGRGGSLELPFPVAVKTGTSQAYHDNWTIGYTRELTVGVWVGNFDRRPLRNSSGVTGAAPIFHDVMLAAEERRRAAGAAGWSPGRVAWSLGPLGPGLSAQAVGLELRDICGLSGLPANRWCPLREREWLPRERHDAECTWHHLTDEGLLVLWPPTYRSWAREHGLLAAAAQPPRVFSSPAGALAAKRTAVPLTILNPAEGATYLIDPTLRREFQTLPLKALAAGGEILWTVNGVEVGRALEDEGVDWTLSPGSHRIVASDGRTSAAVQVLVK
jgi:penicillin-binding protein 1C